MGSQTSLFSNRDCWHHFANPKPHDAMMFRLLAVVVVQMSVHLSVVMSPARMDQASYENCIGSCCCAPHHRQGKQTKRT